VRICLIAGELKAVPSEMRGRCETGGRLLMCLAGTVMHLVALGCGDDGAPSDCTGEPTGFYEIEHTERSGTCGSLSTMLVDLSSSHWATGDVRAGCTGERDVSTDGCTRQVTMTCLADRTPRFDFLCQMASTLDVCSEPPLITLRGSVEWSPGYDEAHGTLALSQSGTGADCSGLWDVQLLSQ
jgi:hypothetical protein